MKYAIKRCVKNSINTTCSWPTWHTLMWRTIRPVYTLVHRDQFCRRENLLLPFAWCLTSKCIQVPSIVDRGLWFAAACPIDTIWILLETSNKDTLIKWSNQEWNWIWTQRTIEHSGAPIGAWGPEVVISIALMLILLILFSLFTNYYIDCIYMQITLAYPPPPPKFALTPLI